MIKKISFKPTSDFALLDIKKGRNALRKLIVERGYIIPVTIEGVIVGQWSGDDSVSIEFQVDVTKLKLGKPRTKFNQVQPS